jgi:cytochrome P450
MQTEIQKEIDEINKEEELDYDRIDNSNYLDLFVREVLRMFPGSIQVISRKFNQDTVLCGYNIRKSQCIILRLLKPNKFITQCTSFGKYR